MCVFFLFFFLFVCLSVINSLLTVLDEKVCIYEKIIFIKYRFLETPLYLLKGIGASLDFLVGKFLKI